MKTRGALALAVVTAVALAQAARTAPAGRPAPRPAMAARIAAREAEVYGIVHWGLNTYTDREWGFGDEDPALLDPKSFDADQIVGACRDGGLQGLIVVCKHHDGFCLWPTKTTGHNITKSPFRGGKGDYVREMERACRRAGLKFGVYVSPWDRNSAVYGTPEYVDLYHEQIRELLGGDYGEVFEMWFDGANGGDGYYGGARGKRRIEGDYYRFRELFPAVRRMQPGVCLFNEDDGADLRWPGNEMGILDPDSRATVRSYDRESYLTYCNVGDVDGTTFHVCEADFPLRPGWFWHEKEEGRARSPAYLMKLYLSSVGNGGTMNIGVAPNRDGVLSRGDVDALRGFGRIRELFFADEVKDDATPFNVVVMREDVTEGEHVDGWSLSVGGRELLSGRSIGIKRIRTLAEPVAGRISLRLTEGGGPAGAVEVRRYWVDPELVRTVAAATTETGETDTAKWMTSGK